MPRTPILVVVSVALAISTGASRATIIHVPADHATIQLGIAHAAGGDTVLVAPGTYNETIDFLGKAVAVGSWYLTTGDPVYVGGTVIDGGDTLGPLATFASGEDSLSVLVGLTLQHGRAPRGGGILCQFSAPRIADCVLFSNRATFDGGGIYAYAADPIVENCRVEANTVASNAGGGFGVRYGSPRIAGSVFVGNVAYVGGGIYCIDSSPVIRDNVIDGNTATVSYAGGIMSKNSTSVITGNVISNNHTNDRGGGIFY
jgi:hypothetical protein